MIVTVIIVRMVQMIIDKTIDVVAERQRLVPTTGTMLVANLVSAAIMVGRAVANSTRSN